MKINHVTKRMVHTSPCRRPAGRRTMSIALAVLCAGWLGSSSSAQELAASDPLEDIAAEMRTVVGRLSKLATDNPTQKNQKEVINKLDTLIAELEKECEKCKGSMSRPNPTKPAGDSNIKSGPGGMGKLHAARNEGDRWGELPAHERDRILQSMNDGFPAHYQSILETYFKRLAEEKPAEDTSPPKTSKKSSESEKSSEKTPEKSNSNLEKK
jgi:hypothetical protein